MTTSREELRQRVDELESTVRGLTQELVEANERIRQLEEEHEETPETIVAGDNKKTNGSTAPGVESDPASAGETDTGDSEETDEIIVA
jgi:chromosome segregation ATPase